MKLEKKNIEIKSPVQILVEGNDGMNFFEKFSKRIGIQEKQIHNFGGVKDLRRFLRVFVRLPGFETVRRLGIIRDAEESASSAFKSVQSGLRDANLPVPKIQGTLVEGSPAVGALILPEQGSGMLETLICRSIAGTRADGCIDEFFACIQSNGMILGNPDKSRASAYLATTRTPQVSVGVAAKKGIWQLDHEAFNPIAMFLRLLTA